jgi:hypothetical protein
MVLFICKTSVFLVAKVSQRTLRRVMNWTPYIAAAALLLLLGLGVMAIMRWERLTFGRLAPSTSKETTKVSIQSRFNRVFTRDNVAMGVVAVMIGLSAYAYLLLPAFNLVRDLI